MKIWILSALALLFWLPLPAPKPPEFHEPAPDVFVFNSKGGKAMAVVTPDPFSDPEGEGRVWRAELHVQIENRSIVHEILFHSVHVHKKTLGFHDTERGFEVHIREQRDPTTTDHHTLRRLRFRRHEIRELGVGGPVKWI